MSEMFLPGFLFISRYISLDLLSLGRHIAEADSGWGVFIPSFRELTAADSDLISRRQHAI